MACVRAAAEAVGCTHPPDIRVGQKGKNILFPYLAVQFLRDLCTNMGDRCDGAISIISSSSPSISLRRQASQYCTHQGAFTRLHGTTFARGGTGRGGRVKRLPKKVCSQVNSLIMRKDSLGKRRKSQSWTFNLVRNRQVGGGRLVDERESA